MPKIKPYIYPYLLKTPSSPIPFWETTISTNFLIALSRVDIALSGVTSVTGEFPCSIPISGTFFGAVQLEIKRARDLSDTR